MRPSTGSGMSARPSDQQALAVGRAVLALVDALGLRDSRRESYDVSRLPPGVTARAFRDRHAARVRAGVDGWTRVGRARIVTREAWEKDAAAETSRARARKPTTPTAANDKASDDFAARLDTALGIRPRKASAR